MKKIPAFLAGLLFASLPALAAESLPGKWLEGQVAGPDKGDKLEYRLYVPASQGNGPAPLVVMLHGCTQGPEVFAESTRMNAVAESGRFLVLYPAQQVKANPTRCWNWFLPKNQARGGKEPASIVAMIDQVAGQYPVDRKRVYVAGLSAGASLGVILAACYPEVFAAASVAGGTMYKAATSLPSAQKVMLTGKAPDPDPLGGEAWACGGRQRLQVPLMVWQGEGDNVVNKDNGAHIVRQFTRLNDWADDGQANASALQGPVSRSGRVDGGHAYTVTSYTFRGRPLIEFYQVAEMGHAWSGGKDNLLFSDAKGPDASLLTWEFFRQFSR